MKKIISALLLLTAVFTMISCDTESDRTVTYFVTNSQSGFNISFLDADGVVQATSYSTQSKSDKISVYTFLAEPGDIVYMSVTDTVANSFVMARILVNGKVYKEASRTDDNNKPLTVSGTIPY